MEKLSAMRAVDGFDGSLTAEEVEEVYGDMPEIRREESFLTNLYATRHFWIKKFFDDQLGKPVLDYMNLNNFNMDTTMVRRCGRILSASVCFQVDDWFSVK